MRSNWASAQQTAKAAMARPQQSPIVDGNQRNRPRQLQDIDWNRAVQWVYSTTAATNFGVLTLF